MPDSHAAMGAYSQPGYEEQDPFGVSPDSSHVRDSPECQVPGSRQRQGQQREQEQPVAHADAKGTAPAPVQAHSSTRSEHQTPMAVMGG